MNPWGLEVKNKLLVKGLKQKDLVDHLNEKGYSVTKSIISTLIKGVGFRAREKEVREINLLLGINTDESR
jgi:arginine repressor